MQYTTSIHVPFTITGQMLLIVQYHICLTEDEDFGILLDALEGNAVYLLAMVTEVYHAFPFVIADYSMAADTSLLPNILCVITGM